MEAHSNVRDMGLIEAKLAYIRAWQALPEYGISYFVIKMNNSKKEVDYFSFYIFKLSFVKEDVFLLLFFQILLNSFCCWCISVMYPYASSIGWCSSCFLQRARSESLIWVHTGQNDILCLVPEGFYHSVNLFTISCISCCVLWLGKYSLLWHVCYYWVSSLQLAAGLY